MTENSKSPRIVVLNTRAANVHSVEKALRNVGADPLVTSDPADLASADAAVLPGVGASDAVMRALNSLGKQGCSMRYGPGASPALIFSVKAREASARDGSPETSPAPYHDSSIGAPARSKASSVNVKSAIA